MVKISLKLVAGGREGELLAAGWTKQTTAAEPRLSEIVDNYRGLGFEVQVIEHGRRDDGCDACFDAGRQMGQVYGDVYIRRGKFPPPEDELF